MQLDSILGEFDSLLERTLAKSQEEMDEGDHRVLLQESINCERSFFRFLRYCWIVEPPSPGEGGSGGVIKLELWPHILDIIKHLRADRLLVIVKARQIGVSWICAAYDLWFALFHKGAVVLLYSKGELEAAEKLAKCKRILDNLPFFLRQVPRPESTMELGFPIMLSAIKALPSTEMAGLSFTASIIDCDEWEEHPYAKEHYLAAKPTIDAGGQFIGVFTVNKLKASSLARETFVAAQKGLNNFTPLFYPYHVRPGRDEKWYQERKRELTPNQLEGLTPELYMEGAYPLSIDEALRPSQTVAAFDLAMLDSLVGETSAPIRVEGVDSHIIKVFKPFHFGESYVAASDSSHGVGQDFNVTVILNVKTGEVVADILNNRLSPEEFAFHTLKLLELYKNPRWWPEDNDWGRVVISVAQSYPNFGRHKDKPGFHTDEKTRLELWGYLIPAVNNRQIRILNIEGLRQFYDIIRNVDKEGRIEARSGRNDDYPLAVGIAWLKRDETLRSFSAKPISTLTFER